MLARLDRNADVNDRDAAAAGARIALGAVRCDVRYDTLPVAGPARLVALRRLQAVIVADTGATIDRFIEAGWNPLDHVDAVDGYRAWLGRLIDEAVDAGVIAWRRSQP